ncbi:MAG TPA: hypothetical protein VFU72_03640 [Nitrolancea sp.]|nr:hypothetical protein [Nitrolancea sp.]
MRLGIARDVVRRPHRDAVRLAIILLLGLGARLALAPHGGFAGDAQSFRRWAVALVQLPLGDFYASISNADHLPGDLWLLWGVAHLYHLVSPEMDVQGAGFLFLLKLVPALADAGVGAMLFVIARQLAGARAGLLAAAGYVFNPAVIFLSATWGQWDAVSAFVMTVALWLLLRGDLAWALPVLSYATLIKPQIALLFPLLALACWRWSRDGAVVGAPRGFRPWQPVRLALGALASLALFLALSLPFGVGLPLMGTRWNIVERLSFALNRYQSVSLNAFNLWGILGHAGAGQIVNDRRPFLLGVSYHIWGEFLFALAALGALALFAWRPGRLMALWAAFALFFAAFMLPTRVHERYLLPALVLGIALAAVVPAMRWLVAALSLTYLVNIVAVYRLSDAFGFRSASPRVDELVLLVSAVNLFLLLVSYAYGVALARAGEQDEATATRRASGQVVTVAKGQG